MEKEGSGDKKKVELPAFGLAKDILGRGPGDGEEHRDAPAAQEAAPETAQDAAKEDSLHLVGFNLNGEEYALDISKVQEIIRVAGWTRVPNSPAHVKGVINLRGRIIPIVDPKSSMGLEVSDITKDSRIMVIEVHKRTLGMLVDGVTQVLRLPVRLIEQPPEEVHDTGACYIRAVGKLVGRLIILLDLENLMEKEHAAKAAAHSF